jgi:cytosine/uracil/thiamine/allantoin permease
MKKTIIRELFWFVISALLSVVIAFIILWMISLTSVSGQLNQIEKILTIQLYAVSWVISLISIYIIRIVVKGIYKLMH